MNTTGRYVLVILALFGLAHWTLSFTHESYGKATSLSNIASQLGMGAGLSASDQHPAVPGKYFDEKPVNSYTGHANSSVGSTLDSNGLITRRANATFVVLARNSDVEGTVKSVREMEERFNGRYKYPYVFLNDEPFSAEFIKRLTSITHGFVEFGVVPKEHWVQPDWIDEDKAKAGRDEMVKNNIIYGGSVSYRNMCRFNSGFFFKHELLQKYRYYWRIEPDVHFHCDVNYDPFLFMQDNKKIYGFTITMYEYEATIKTLWSTVREFIDLHPEYISEDNSLGFMTTDNGKKYNLCHWWSNFEIADMDFWRGEAYQKFFNYLDSKGGFYYERWGDAPVHSIAAALFAKKEQMHNFKDMGYEHNPYTHCPLDDDVWTKGRCSCDPARSFDYDGYSCMSKWDAFTAE